jgi:hypothetical protein
MDLRAAVHTITADGAGAKVIIPGGLTSTGPVDWLMVYWTHRQVPPGPTSSDKVLFELVLEWVMSNLLVIITVVMVVMVVYFIVPSEMGRKRREEELVVQYRENLEEQRDKEE